MDVRLVAYRRLNTGITDPFNVTEYELDLKEAPDVVLKFNWLDIKQPDKRKGSHSQTVKLPFTNRNNTFFENFFDVNLDTLVFNAKYKFNMVVYVDSVPQMKGYLQLKQLYLNARYYEVVLFGNTGNFFADIKGKKLRRAFENEISVGDNAEPTYVIDDQLDHYLSCKNIVDSWTTGLTTINSATDNDVMYPIVDYGHTANPYNNAMFSNPSELGNMVGDNTWTDLINQYGFLVPGNLKPAIRLRRLLYIIAQKAGYTIESAFLGINQNGTFIGEACTQESGLAGCYDSNGDCVNCGGVTYPYFGRLFMTLADEHLKTYTEYVGNAFHLARTNQVDKNIYWNYVGVGEYWYYNTIQFFLDTPPSDPYFDSNGLYSVNEYTETIPQNGQVISSIWNQIQFPSITEDALVGVVSGNDLQIQLKFDFRFDMPTSEGPTATIYNTVKLTVNWQFQFSGSNTWTNNPVEVLVTGANEWHTVVFNCPYTEAAAGGLLRFRGVRVNSEDSPLFGYNAGMYFNASIKNRELYTINQGQVAYGNGVENGTVIMAQNMPDITQSDFVKDLINRFNLVILNDPDNEQNLIIEPYQDYIASGSTKYWTDKLDVSKEQVLKSTNEIQSSILSFEDKKNDDYLNKGYFEQYQKVYGANTRENFNDFVDGEFKNFSIFSPFISQMLPSIVYGNINTSIYNPYAIASRYGINDSGERYPLDKQSPSIFYYGGTPKTVTGNSPVDITPTATANSFHIISAGYGVSNVWTSYATDQTGATSGKFPICTQYNLDDITNTAGITTSTKQLLWGWVSPRFTSPYWSANPFGTTVTQNGYFQEYWASFINEVYSDEARIMDCYLYLTADDIREFESNAFKNTYYIKNTLWRILSIDGYLAGGNKSTKVKLLKVVEKLSYDCVASPSLFNLNGTITYVDPANPSGGAVTITNTCCEELNPDWTFVQTNESTGEGICHWNLTVTQTNPGGGDGTIPEENYDEQTFSSMLPMPSNTIANQIILPGQQAAIYATAFLSTTTFGTTLAKLKNISNGSQMSPPVDSMTYIKMDLIGTIAGADNNTNVGEVAHFQYDTIVKRIGNEFSFTGTSGGVPLKVNKDLNFPTPTISMTTTDGDTGELILSITSGSADYNIKWVAKLELIMQYASNETYVHSLALFQNGDNILFQDVNFLEWN